MAIYFTIRERQVLDLVEQALLRKQIASRLEISIRTVDAHLNKIHLKTNTTTMGELMLFLAAEIKSGTA